MNHRTTPQIARHCSLPVALGASLLFGACSGGSTTIEVEAPETTVSFAASSLDVGESGGLATVTVLLGTTLAETQSDITVEIVDAGTGTATSGADYAPFSTQMVTFPAGSTNGDTQTALLTTSADNLAEGANETIQLQLQNASGAPVFGIGELAVQIVDTQEASLSFQNPSTLTPDEASTSYPIAVVLDVSAGATLAFDVEVSLADDGTGTATAGSDYTAFATQVITFPAGTADGATAAFSVDVLDDADLEGSESFALHLTGAGMDALDRGGPVRHVFTITDDEAPPTPALGATHGVTGTETTLPTTGGSINLGTQVGDAGPNVGSLLILANQGGGDMSLGTPLLTSGDTGDFKIEVEAASTAGGMRTSQAIPPPSDVYDLGAPFVRDAGNVTQGGSTGARPGVSVTVDEAALVDLTLVDRVRLHSFPMPDMGDVTLELTRVPLPLAQDAVLFVDGQPVAGGPAALLSDLTTWTGTALELPGSKAFMTFSSAGPQGFVQMDAQDGRTVHLSPETPATANSPATCRLVHEADLAQMSGYDRTMSCAGATAPPGFELPPMTAANPGEDPPTAGTTTVSNCRLAIETDYQFFQKFGTSQGVTDYVTGLVAAISDQYFEDVQTTFSIAYLGIYTTAADPWTTPDTPGDTADMLNEFRTAWAGNWPANADLAHFLSGADLGGGRAYLNVLCNQSFGFGVSGDLNGNLNWNTWTGVPGNFTWDFVVVAHELGHNFGADHTHEYCPPLDECYAATCVASTTCSQGTLMSYCHTCGGLDNINLRFHPSISNIMRQRVDSSCLGDALMQAGDSVRYRLRFDPRSGAGVKSATLSFDHDAPNATAPYPIVLTGTAN